MEHKLLPSFSKIILLFLFLTLSAVEAFAQQDPDPLRFERQVAQIQERYADHPKDGKSVLFTGSSSIRMWDELKLTFPEHDILNTGFGGSHASDLLYYLEELVIQYAPQKIFIYEGDNDLNSGKSGEVILGTIKELVSMIHEDLPESEIILISAKPSISRWHLKEGYKNLNQWMEHYAKETNKVYFANIWDVMLDDNGEPLAHIFLEDDLHMNQKGYDLWAEVIGEFLE